MESEQFLRALEDELQQESGSLSLGLRLKDWKAWDSMNALGYMSLVDREFGVQVTGDQLDSCKTVGDLVRLVSIEF